MCSRYARSVSRATTYEAVCLFFLAACDGARSTLAAPAPAGSRVSIVGITPTTDEAFLVGQRVRLELKVAYELTAESGSLDVFIQDAEGQAFAMSRMAITRGVGNEDFALEFKVPNTKSIQVFVPLGAEGQQATTTMATREFRVSAK